MINLFKNYLDNGYVKKKTPDFEEAKALLEKAKPVTNEDAKSSIIFALEFINKISLLLKFKK